MTKSITLTRGKVALVDDEDYERINAFKWCFQAKGYAYRHAPVERFARGKVLWMHKVLMNAPDGVEVDHINLDKLDNRRQNLRLATRAENSRNVHKRAHNTSGYKGVCWDKQHRKWKPQITILGRNVQLPLCDSCEAAARAYDAAAARLFGEFARLNFREEVKAV